MGNKPRKELSMKAKANIVGWVFVAPALLGFLLFNLLPMALSAYYSLCEYKGYGEATFVGLQNYREMLTGVDTNFWPSVTATVKYVLLAVPCNLLFALLIAMLLNTNIKGRAMFRSIFYLPSILPGVATSFVWMLLMNPDFGLFNTILKAIHLPTSLFFWDKNSVIPSIVFMGIWATGSTQVIFLAGLQDIPRNYYEALEIDGGGYWARFRYVTLPLLSPTVFFNLVMGIIGSLQVFGSAYIITDGGPNNASLFYVYQLWRQAFKYISMGKASAMAWMLFIVIAFLTMIVFGTSNKWVYYEGGEQ